MKFDCIVVGGGVAGLTCALKCAEEGLRTAVVSSGMNALHFSSGSIDVLGFGGDKKIVYDPFDDLHEFIKEHPGHPYSKCGGVESIENAIRFFREKIRENGPDLFYNGRRNHFSVTALGTLKPTYLSQKSVFNEKLKEVFSRKPKIALLTFEGFRDFYPALAAANHKRTPMIRDCELVTGSVALPESVTTRKNPHEFRSIDICRLFDSERGIETIAGRIRDAAAGAEIVGIPAILGILHYDRIHHRLEELTGALIYEIPTLPPSILGMRLDNALKEKYAELGGLLIAGDEVAGGEFEGGRLASIRTRNYGSEEIKADCFVLATGSYFSRGITSKFDDMKETVFNFQLEYELPRNKWRRSGFFDPKSHPFLEYGVKTNDLLNPFTQSGTCVENVFCAGAILAHYNPVREGSGSGVAISAAVAAASRIASHCRRG